MPETLIRQGILTIAQGELFANISTPIPGHIDFKSDGPGVIVPIPKGIDGCEMADLSGVELKAYLEHGMAFSGTFHFSDRGEGLGVVGAIDLKPITSGDIRYVAMLNSILETAELLAGYVTAKVRAGVDLTLGDWQGEERDDKTTPDTLSLRIAAEDQRILLTTRDGRKVDLEMQDGDLRIMAFENDDGKEAPVVTILPRDGDIGTDREDYDRETRLDIDEPAM